MRAFGRVAMWAVISIVAVVALFRLTSLRWWKVPADDPYLVASVAPTLRAGDWVLLWRLTPPSPGSLTLCPEPKHPDRVVIGRMVGDEGQRVKVSGTYIEVSGKPLKSEGDCKKDRFTVVPPKGGSEIELRCSTEVVSNWVHERGEAEAIAEIPDYEVKINAGEVALVSDNRRFPYDSRDFGLVDRSTCRETVFFRLFGREGFSHSPSRFTYIR